MPMNMRVFVLLVMSFDPSGDQVITVDVLTPRTVTVDYFHSLEPASPFAP